MLRGSVTPPLGLSTRGSLSPAVTDAIATSPFGGRLLEAGVAEEVAFLGGYNIGSLYATQWRDTHLRVVGHAGLVDDPGDGQRRQRGLLVRL